MKKKSPGDESMLDKRLVQPVRDLVQRLFRRYRFSLAIPVKDCNMRRDILQWGTMGHIAL